MKCNPLFHLKVNGNFKPPLFNDQRDCDCCALTMQNNGIEAEVVYVSPQNVQKMLRLHQAITDARAKKWSNVF